MRSFLFASLLVCLVHSNCFSQSANKFPKGEKAAIILTYDDALLSHLNVAIPQLNSAKLKGTFFLDGRLSIEEMKRWGEAAKKGHEMANHSLNHPCLSQSVKQNPRLDSETYDKEMILREISAMNKILYGIDGDKNRTYAYPCVEFKVGGKDYRDTLKSTKIVKYARGGGDKNSIITDFKSLDVFTVPSWFVAPGTSGTELIDFVNNVKAKNGVGVFLFHGTGGDYLNVSAEAHQQLIDYLAKSKAEIWVGTFQEVLDHLSKSREN